jgi:hypothetical protein
MDNLPEIDFELILEVEITFPINVPQKNLILEYVSP